MTSKLPERLRLNRLATPIGEALGLTSCMDYHFPVEQTSKILELLLLHH